MIIELPYKMIEGGFMLQIKHRRILKQTIICGGLAMLSACGSDSTSSQSTNIATLLGEASDYVADSFPDFQNTVGATTSNINFGTLSVDDCTGIDWILAPVWSSDGGDCAEHLFFPPGGSLGTGEPTYEGQAIPASVNYRDYFKMSLDPNFERKSSDGGNYTPGLFGRFNSMVEVLGYLSSANLTLDADGTPATGTQLGSVELDQGTILIQAEVSIPSNTLYYDKVLHIKGHPDMNSNGVIDDNEEEVLDTLMWLRSNGTQVNFMQVDEGSGENRTSMYIDTLKWNTSTGELAYEYISDSNDTDESGNAQISHYRVYISGSNSKAWMYGLDAKTDSTDANNNALHYAIYVPTPDTTQGTISIHDKRSSSLTFLGNLCTTFSTGSGIAGSEAMPGDSEEASGGSCAGQSADALNIKAAGLPLGNSMRSETTYNALAGEKGFPIVSHATYTTSSEATTAWKTAGEEISVSFSGRTSFLNDLDSTP